MTFAEYVFWGSAALLAYVYVGYPLLMTLLAAVRRPAASSLADDSLPSVTVLVTAYNEAGRIGQRIENLLALDYPRDRLEVLVGSDGSTDDTAQMARSWASRGRVVVYAFGVRRGKPAMLNDLVPRAAGSIVVLADARQRFAPGALRALAARFADPKVGS
jgi:cellulose synthase/poly-beta-1,6-N-acetylglucosamine synthase-like glycosyltransferase